MTSWKSRLDAGLQMINPLENETVPCVWCSVPTRMIETRRCDRCYELESRIRGDLALAQKMIAQALAGPPK
jgi:hypothetical protein